VLGRTLGRPFAVYHFAVVRVADLKELHFAARYSELRSWYQDLKQRGAVSDEVVGVAFPAKHSAAATVSAFFGNAAPSRRARDCSCMLPSSSLRDASLCFQAQLPWCEGGPPDGPLSHAPPRPWTPGAPASFPLGTLRRPGRPRRSRVAAAAPWFAPRRSGSLSRAAAPAAVVAAAAAAAAAATAAAATAAAEAWAPLRWGAMTSSGGGLWQPG
jgi:hypothetical protein